MGRHFEVRAKAMAASAAKKGALNMRASKEIYIAAKNGVPDPNSNLALRSAIDKWKGQGVPKDVIDRAIKKAAGGDAESFISGRYEYFGPGGSYLIVDTLSNNVNRALADVRSTVEKKGGHMGSVIYNFNEYGILAFKGDNRDAIEEALILGDVDVSEVSLEEGIITCLVAPSDFAKARNVLSENGVSEYETSQISFIPNEYITITDEEDKRKFSELLDKLDDLEDVQEVYHNVEGF